MSNQSSVRRAAIYQRRVRRTRSPLVRPLPVRDIDADTETTELHQYMAALEQTRGPYAPPYFVRGYNDIEEGLGSEVLRTGIRRVEATTNIDLEESRTKQTIDLRGQWIAAGIVVLVLLVATIWLAMGYPTAATILATTLIVALAIVFIGSSKIDVIAPYFGRRQPENDSNAIEKRESDEK